LVSGFLLEISHQGPTFCGVADVSGYHVGLVHLIMVQLLNVGRRHLLHGLDERSCIPGQNEDLK
jgi:hypothetical protein